MEQIKLCDSEYRFLQVVWNHEPVPSGHLTDLCREQLGWKKSTTYTVLKKLGEKGVLKNENAVVTSLVPRDAVAAEESRRFVEKTFGGSLPGFVAAFLGSRTLTETEAEELKRLIDTHREEEE